MPPAPPHRLRAWLALALFAATWPVAGLQAWDGADIATLHALWPTVVALALVLLLRRALVGLLAGAAAGAVLLAGGDPWAAYLGLAADHFAPIFNGPWKVGAIAFTLLMGGFAGVIEKGGGLAAVFRRLVSGGGDAARRLQGSALGLGLLCFFDGLANSMLVGRLTRALAAPSGVSRVKLAYIVDSTSAAVACVAFFSTWIAAQLSYINDGFARLGREADAYGLFFASIPLNFYCWFTLLLVGLSAWRGFNPGPMARFEAEARRASVANPGSAADTASALAAPRAPGSRGLLSALVPLAVLILAIPVGFYLLGLPRTGEENAYLPLTRDKIRDAFGSSAGPLVLILASLVATAAAIAFWPWRRNPENPLHAQWDGMKALLPPVGILLGAWMLGSTLTDLGANAFIARLVSDNLALWAVPAVVFATGAAIAFSTGTSWGTMALLMPLSIEVLGSHPQLAADPAAGGALFPAIIAAVFSGAVFGDHCSPISDTTIVSSIATGVEPVDHVKTQMPFALIAAAVALLLGFLPAGFGLPGWLGLLLGAGLLGTLVLFGTRGGRATSA